jgi:hypothetical protein
MMLYNSIALGVREKWVPAEAGTPECCPTEHRGTLAGPEGWLSV